MIFMIQSILAGLYLISLIFVLIYCTSQFYLMIRYLFKAEKPTPILKHNDPDLPFVTIQLPVYNEKYVTGRLIDCIMSVDYPKEKFEVHILDDSTDETLQISKSKASHYSRLGYNIECITRSDRSGFKAGALRDAMAVAKGNLIAVFDADFLPDHDFLLKTVGQFKNPEVGVVQTRWSHLNENDSLLTLMQAFQLNVHFTIEQGARYKSGYFLQFNGTGGIWRKECISSAGGWEADTLTEDLDLSYRAQLKGWKIDFMEQVATPAELPAEISALKSQQHRWMKGGAETARKLLPTLWKSDIGLEKKIQGSIHLLASTVYVSVFMLGVLSVPLAWMQNIDLLHAEWLSIFYLPLFMIIFVYFVANAIRCRNKNSFIIQIFRFILIFPVFLAFSMGMAFHNALAVIQGWMKIRSAFIRTPKIGTIHSKNILYNNSYLKKSYDATFDGELILCLYFLVAVLFGILSMNNHFLLFHITLFAGYGGLVFYSVQRVFK